METDYTSSFDCRRVCVCVRAVCLAFCLKQNAIITMCSVCFEHNFLFPFLNECPHPYLPGVCVCLCHGSFLLLPMKLQLYLFKAHYPLVFDTELFHFWTHTHWETSTLHCMPSQTRCNGGNSIRKDERRMKNKMRMDMRGQWKEWAHPDTLFCWPENNAFWILLCVWERDRDRDCRTQQCLIECFKSTAIRNSYRLNLTFLKFERSHRRFLIF